MVSHSDLQDGIARERWLGGGRATATSVAAAVTAVEGGPVGGSWCSWRRSRTPRVHRAFRRGIRLWGVVWLHGGAVEGAAAGEEHGWSRWASADGAPAGWSCGR